MEPKLTGTTWAKVAAAGLVGLGLGFLLARRQQKKSPRIAGKLLGIDQNGEQVHEWTLSNDAGDFRVTLSSLGCAVTSVLVNGKDVVLVSAHTLTSSFRSPLFSLAYDACKYELKHGCLWNGTCTNNHVIICIKVCWVQNHN